MDYNRASGFEPTGASWARGIEVGGWGQRVDGAGGRSTRGGGVDVTGGGWNSRVAPEGTGVSAPTSAWDRDNREVGWVAFMNIATEENQIPNFFPTQ